MENIRACIVRSAGEICMMNMTPSKESIEKMLGGEYSTFELSGKNKAFVIATRTNGVAEGKRENAHFVGLFGDVLIMGLDESNNLAGVGDRFNSQVLMDLILSWDLAREEEWK